MHADPDPGIFLTLDPGWEKFWSGINVPDPQHCLAQKIKKILLIFRKSRLQIIRNDFPRFPIVVA